MISKKSFKIVPLSILRGVQHVMRTKRSEVRLAVQQPEKIVTYNVIVLLTILKYTFELGYNKQLGTDQICSL